MKTGSIEEIEVEEILNVRAKFRYNEDNYLNVYEELGNEGPTGNFYVTLVIEETIIIDNVCFSENELEIITKLFDKMTESAEVYNGRKR